MLGWSAVQPVFEDVDIKGYTQIGGMAFPPLLPLSCMHFLTPSRTSKAWASLRCVDAGVTPRSLDTSLLAVAL